jgi:hypothetical protein
MLLLASCRASHAPRAAVPRPADVPTRVEGSWVVVTPVAGAFIAGELIAAHADTIFLWSGDALVSTPMRAVRRVELSRYRANTAAIATGTLLGVLSTVSHGFWLILTAPIWALTGTITAVSDTRNATLETTNPGTLAPWARFPAGLPSSVDRRQLRGVIRPPAP